MIGFRKDDFLGSILAISNQSNYCHSPIGSKLFFIFIPSIIGFKLPDSIAAFATAKQRLLILDQMEGII
jgi:hypothetical protein